MIDDRVLKAVFSGRINLSVNGKPLLSIDGTSKSVGLEAAGLKENDVKVSRLLGIRHGMGKLFAEASQLEKFVKMGWSFALYDRGETLMNGGRDVSRLTGHIHFNPKKLKKILEVL
jgi:hypothetical protein